MPIRTADVIAALRGAGASFALVFGSTVTGTAGPGSDLDVAAWWPEAPPQPWEVDVPGGVDLTIRPAPAGRLAGGHPLHLPR